MTRAPVSRHLACDLGAESGRVLLGTLDPAAGQLDVEELHRFPNRPARTDDGSLRWDAPRLFGEIKEGLRRAAARGWAIRSVSVDSWGVDYAFYNRQHALLASPHCYRDGRTASLFAATLGDLAERKRVFDETGLQFLPFNTLYQLRDDLARQPDVVAAADGFLLLADYFNYRLAGVARAEETLASTTQLYHPARRAWSTPLQHAYGLPPRLFPPLIPAGTVLGPLLAGVAAETGLDPAIQVVASCSHDTAAAVAAVPVTATTEPAGGDDDWAFLSSGTWSLLGLELSAPLLHDAVLAAGFTNEAGFGGTTRLLKNNVGLWLLQECRRTWAEREDPTSGERTPSYGELAGLAEAAEPFRSLVDPGDPRFLPPDDMPGRLAAFCRETGQPAPATPGQFARAVFESLALSYARTLADAERLADRRVDRLHVLGGGSKNAVLNQFTADALGRPVLAGPAEATAIGNVLVQAIALGVLPSLAAARGVVARSFPPERFAPRADPAAWREAHARFAGLRG